MLTVTRFTGMSSTTLWKGAVRIGSTGQDRICMRGLGKLQVYPGDLLTEVTFSLRIKKSH